MLELKNYSVRITMEMINTKRSRKEICSSSLAIVVKKLVQISRVIIYYLIKIISMSNKNRAMAIEE